MTIPTVTLQLLAVTSSTGYRYDTDEEAGMSKDAGEPRRSKKGEKPKGARHEDQEALPAAALERAVANEVGEPVEGGGRVR